MDQVEKGTASSTYSAATSRKMYSVSPSTAAVCITRLGYSARISAAISPTLRDQMLRPSEPSR